MVAIKLKRPLGEERQSLEVEVDGVKYIELLLPATRDTIGETVGLAGLDVLIIPRSDDTPMMYSAITGVPRMYSTITGVRSHGRMQHRYALGWFDSGVNYDLWSALFDGDYPRKDIRILFRSDQLIDPEPPAIKWWELPRGSVVLDDDGMQWIVSGTWSATGLSCRKIVRLSDGVQVYDTMAIDPASYSAPFGGWPKHCKVRIVRVLEVADRV